MTGGILLLAFIHVGANNVKGGFLASKRPSFALLFAANCEAVGHILRSGWLSMGWHIWPKRGGVGKKYACVWRAVAMFLLFLQVTRRMFLYD